MREHVRRASVREELKESEHTHAAITKGDNVLIKVQESVGGIQWLLGVAQFDYGSTERFNGDGAGDNRIFIQWMYAKDRSGQRAQENDLNAKFTPWVMPNTRKGPKNKKNTEYIDRAAVVLIGVQLTKQGYVTQRSKRQVVDLEIGFSLDGENKYNMTQVLCHCR
jgi:hypothetical protein